MADYLQVANEFGLWLIALVVVSICVIQAILYYRQCMKAGKEIGLTEDQLKEGFWVGAKTAIGPAAAIFIIMVGLMTVIGGPMAWMRLAVIGAAPTELTAARLGAEGYGVAFGGEGYGIEAMAVSWWTMIINGIGWLVLVGLIGDKLEPVREKLAGGQASWLPVLSGSAMIGVFGYLIGGDVLTLEGPMYAVIFGAISMIILIKIAEKTSETFKPYCLGIAMIVGMIFAILLG